MSFFVSSRGMVTFYINEVQGRFLVEQTKILALVFLYVMKSVEERDK